MVHSLGRLFSPSPTRRGPSEFGAPSCLIKNKIPFTVQVRRKIVEKTIFLSFRFFCVREQKIFLQHKLSNIIGTEKQTHFLLLSYKKKFSAKWGRNSNFSLRSLPFLFRHSNKIPSQKTMRNMSKNKQPHFFHASEFPKWVPLRRTLFLVLRT